MYKAQKYHYCQEGINKLKNNIAVGLDGIAGKMINKAGDEVKRRIYHMTRQIWYNEKMPED